jgi:predicted MFS family arabinose efflux permease
VATLAEAARVRDFWLLFATFFVCGFTTNGLIGTHLIPMCADYGIAAIDAAGLMAMMGVFDLIGTTGSGWLTDRFDPRKLLFVYYALRGLSLIYLPFTDFTFYGLSLFAVFYGLDRIATVPPTVRLTNAAFGDRAGPSSSGGLPQAIRSVRPRRPIWGARCARRRAPTSRRSSLPARQACARRRWRC